MASIFGHGLVGWALAKGGKCKNIVVIIILSIISAIIPDVDIMAFKWGIPYESMFGHRGITHSISFALVWALCISFFFLTKQRIVFIIIFLSTLSHSILDAMTNGGLGVAFYAPFSAERHFFPFRPIQVSPIGISNFFSEWGWVVVKSELIWIGIPVLIYTIIRRFLK